MRGPVQLLEVKLGPPGVFLSLTCLYRDSSDLVNYSLGFPAPVLVPGQVSAPIVGILCICFSVSNFANSSLPWHLTSMIDLEEFDFFSVFGFFTLLVITMEWRLLSFLNAGPETNSSSSQQIFFFFGTRAHIFKSCKLHRTDCYSAQRLSSCLLPLSLSPCFALTLLELPRWSPPWWLSYHLSSADASQMYYTQLLTQLLSWLSYLVKIWNVFLVYFSSSS